MSGSAWFSRWLRTKPHGDAGGRVGEADLPAGAHVPERPVVGAVHRRDAGDERGRLERVADRPPRGHRHDGVAAADLLRPEALHRRTRHQLLARRQGGVHPGQRPRRGRGAERADLGLQHGRGVHEVGEAGPALLVGEQAPVRSGEHRAPGPGLGVDRPQRALLARLDGELHDRGHRSERGRRRPDGAWPATPSGSRHLGVEERPEARPADAPHELADEPPERHPVVAVAGPRLPGRRARRHPGRDGLGVAPARAVPRQQLVGPGQADGARLVAEQLAHGGRLLAAAAELGPVPHDRRIEVELAPVLEHVGAQGRQALGRRHDHRPGLLLPRRGPAPRDRPRGRPRTRRRRRRRTRRRRRRGRLAAHARPP